MAAPASLRAMQLDRLIAALGPIELANAAPVEVADLAYDMRAVVPGSLFFCVPGSNVDGHDLAADALAAGAAALVVERRLAVSAPQLVVRSVRKAMPVAATTFFGDPSQALEVAAVTGTNGKTTTAFLLASILEAAGRRPALLTNIERRVGGARRPTGLNTPESIDLQRLFREMLDAGRPLMRDGGDVDRCRAGQAHRHALRGARLHEPHAGPSRFPRHDGRVLRGQALALRSGGARRRERRRCLGQAARG